MKKYSLFCCLGLALLLAAAPHTLAATYTATSESQLRSYLSGAQPGDTIQISGDIWIYNGGLITSRAGNSSAFIIIKGINTGRLKLGAYASRAFLNIKHSYYKIYDLTIDANGQSDRGLLIEDADHGKVVNVTVRETRNEAYKIRKNSNYWYFDHCSALETGLADAYGEAFYCGDANANWTTGDLPDETGYITFNYCYAQPFADGFDFKEGTHHIKVCNSTVNWNSQPVDPTYGNHGVSSRANHCQVINCDFTNNTQGNGDCIWGGRKLAKDGVYYGKNLQIKALYAYNMKKYVYYTEMSDTLLFTDYQYSQCAGLKDPASPKNAKLKNPSQFQQMTWSGEGGGTY